jgi:hypothetical protein
VTRAYVAALSRHDGAAVCALFSPQLRAFELKDDPVPRGRPTCVRDLDAHFTGYYSRHRWTSARIVRAGPTGVDRQRGIATVPLEIAHRYICAGNDPLPDGRCNPGLYRRPDIVYLIREGGRWQILKPGLVYRASEVDSPDDNYGQAIYYPPGDATTVARPTPNPYGSVTCPKTRVTVAGHPHPSVTTRLNPAIPPALRIDRFSVARVGPERLCFSLVLAAPPRADAEYSIGVALYRQQAPVDLFDVDFDGLGDPHALVGGVGALSEPAIAPYLPRIGVAGRTITIVGRQRGFAPHRRLLVVAGSGSLQPDEPLLRHPLTAGDGIPYGMCLVFPTGKLTQIGNCGGVPAG